jgi:hypothetical protein
VEQAAVEIDHEKVPVNSVHNHASRLEVGLKDRA